MEIAPVTENDLDDLLDLRERAFGPAPQSREVRVAIARRAMREGRILGGYERGRLIASGRFFDMTQWWHGRAVPMAGVAGVYVAPERRGRGVGRRLMTALLELIAGRGYALSALYPATTPPYHSVGYEHAGAQHVVTLPADALRLLAPADPVPLRRVTAADAAAVARTASALNAASRACGVIDWAAEDISEAYHGDGLFGYLADDGYLQYGWSGDNSEFHVHQLIAGSERTLRTLSALVGSGSSVVSVVRACLAPQDPLLWLLRDRRPDDVRRVPWMLRVLDLPAAIGERGFPAGVEASAVLEVDDSQLPGNGGLWRLTVADGRGVVHRLTDGHRGPSRPPDTVRLTARGMAALYAGVPLRTLRGCGLAHGGTSAGVGAGESGRGAGTGDALEAAFAANPYMLDYF